MSHYQAFYNRQSWEFIAVSLYDAKQQAIRHFNVPKSKQGLLAVEFVRNDSRPTMAEINNY